jgi:predicted nuclease with RNAse H fold
MVSVVGLNLARVETRPIGFCRLSGMKAEAADIYMDEEVLKKTSDSKPKVVAIDAPLSLPPNTN